MASDANSIQPNVAKLAADEIATDGANTGKRLRALYLERASGRAGRRARRLLARARSR
jgi:hypothetical protein